MSWASEMGPWCETALYDIMNDQLLPFSGACHKTAVSLISDKQTSFLPAYLYFYLVFYSAAPIQRPVSPRRVFTLLNVYMTFSLSLYCYLALQSVIIIWGPSAWKHFFLSSSKTTPPPSPSIHPSLVVYILHIFLSSLKNMEILTDCVNSDDNVHMLAVLSLD